MSRTCGSSKNVFQEAIDHCRWKTTLNDMLHNSIRLQDYRDMSFQDIFESVSTICSQTKGIGMLTTYDITAAICRHYSVNVNKVYIIGNGPKRAVRILGLTTKKEKIGSNELNYVEINDIIDSFDKNGYSMDEKVKNSKNGDSFETFICQWQKKFIKP
jgi:hypothetical protein